MFQIYPESGNTIYWNGWRYIQFYLYNFGTGHGGGADDGIVHFPIQYHTIFLLDNQIQANISSAVYISSPVIMYWFEKMVEKIIQTQISVNVN